MDSYLAAAADALTHRTGINTHLASIPDENTYYAQSTWDFVFPAWVKHLLTLARVAHSLAPERPPVARHA